MASPTSCQQFLHLHLDPTAPTRKPREAVLPVDSGTVALRCLSAYDVEAGSVCISQFDDAFEVPASK